MNDLKENERIDDLECNGFCIIQNPSFFCFGMDAVLLANFTEVRKNAKGIDLGTGNGIIPILLTAKGKGKDVTGLELQPEIADMARRSVILNKIEDKCHIVNEDIKNISSVFQRGSFDFVTSNPPYIKEHHGLNNPNAPVNIARHEIHVNLEQVIAGAAFLLREGGSFSMVHKPFRLPEIMELMKKYRLEPKRLQLVEPKAGKEANIVLIEAVKGGGSFLKVLPTLIVYNEDGSYTDEVLRIYGKG